MLMAVALAFTAPLKGFASYKYYIHFKDGSVLMMRADNEDLARMAFDAMCRDMPGMEDAYLTKRPNGGFIACESADDLR